MKLNMTKIVLAVASSIAATIILEKYRSTAKPKPAYRPIGIPLTGDPEADCLSRGGYYYDQTCRIDDKLYAVLANPPPPQWVQVGGQI